jgi:hypothetical protein
MSDKLKVADWLVITRVEAGILLYKSTLQGLFVAGSDAINIVA